LQIALHVFSQNVTFEVDRVAGFAVADVGVFVGVGMTATSATLFCQRATVRLMPSMVMDPFGTM